MHPVKQHELIKDLPLVTDFPTRAHWEAAVWQILLERIVTNTSNPELEEAFELLISPQERKSIIYRALTGSRIYSGIGTAEISRELWLTRQTIAAIKKSMLQGNFRSARLEMKMMGGMTRYHMAKGLARGRAEIYISNRVK
jgi:Trp operon repressor